MLARVVRMSIAVAVLALPACVVKLSHENAPLTNGDVTGQTADCTSAQPLGLGGPGIGAGAVKFTGRFVTAPAGAVFDWSGNEISARFEGTEATVGLTTGAPILLMAVVDDRPPIKFEAIPKRTGYLVVSGLPSGVHTITIHRNSEPLYGPLSFTGFNFGPNSKLLPPIEHPRRIEIIGDSITCGYGNEGQNATCPFDVFDGSGPDAARIPLTENQYLAFGSLAGRTLSADTVTLCYSGKGIYQNYREGAQGEGTAINQDVVKTDPDGKTLMPRYYQRTLASQPDSPLWDFGTEPEPQVVVIALGTNDFSRDVNNDSVADGIDVSRFRAAYSDFVGFIRSKRPNAHIFMSVSPMVTDKFPLDNARSDFRSTLKGIAAEFDAKGDKKVYAMEMVEQGSVYGLGCDYHPNLTVHEIMSQQLVGAIRSKLCW